MKVNETLENLYSNYAKNQGRAAALLSIAKSCEHCAMDMELRYNRMPDDRVFNKITERIAKDSIYKIRMHMTQMEEYLKAIEETFICEKESENEI